jgi:photosystem II stability/assembly factor-like uncharacterized protein
MKFRTTIFILFLNFSAQGQTWTQVPSGVTTQLNSIFSVNHDIIYTVGHNGVGLKTINSGATWNQLNISPATRNAVRFVSPTTGFMAGNNLGVLKTSDAGNSWTYISGGNPELHDFYFPDSVSGWAVGDLEMGFGALFNPFTTTFIQINGIAGKVLRGIWFTNSLTGIAVGNFGAIVRTVNGGATWLPQISNTSELLCKIMFVNSTTGIAVGYNGIILKTNDGGTNWTQLNSGTTENLFALYYADTSNVWVCGDNGLILHSNNAGLNWVTENSGTTQSLQSIHGIDSTDVWACGLGGIILHRTLSSGGPENTTRTIYNLYPNPAHQYSTLEFMNPNSEEHFLNLYNSMGKLVRKTNEIRTTNIRIERGNLSSGLYFFQLSGTNKIVGAGKLMFD